MAEKKVAPRGRSKSGRVWREPGIRSSSKVVNMGPKTSWMKQLTKRSETKAMKDFEREMKDAVQKKREERKKKIIEKRQRKLDNQKKGEIVQKITNASKLKRLKKRQMRMIEKR